MVDLCCLAQFLQTMCNCPVRCVFMCWLFTFRPRITVVWFIPPRCHYGACLADKCFSALTDFCRNKNNKESDCYYSLRSNVPGILVGLQGDLLFMECQEILI